MKFRFDNSKPYAVALEGGGARGAYQVGAWRALEENGVKFCAVAGSSVGALNGAMIAMRDLPTAEVLWNDMSFSRVMNVNDEDMRRLFAGKLLELDFKHIGSGLKKIVKDGGFDVTPLRRLIAETVDVDKIKASPIRLFICAHSITDHKGIDIDVKSLPVSDIHDMLLASAYFPAFKHEPLCGKMYTDGGVSNVLPLSPLIDNGYKDIISIRLYGFGVEKKVKIPKGTTVIEIAPKRDLGKTLNFDADACRKNYRLGYFDTMRMLYGLYGERYYIDRTLSEEDAYKILCKTVKLKRSSAEKNLRSLHEEMLKFAKESGSKGDYYDVLIAYAEKSAEKFKIDELGICTDVGLLEKIAQKKGGHI